jgi:hypothetical protein
MDLVILVINTLMAILIIIIILLFMHLISSLAVEIEIFTFSYLIRSILCSGVLDPILYTALYTGCFLKT